MYDAPLPPLAQADFPVPALIPAQSTAVSVSGRVACWPPRTCAVDWIEIRSQVLADPVQRSTSYHGAHGPVAAAGLFLVFPETETVRVRWRLTNQPDVASGVLLCFRSGSNLPIWSHVINAFNAAEEDLAWTGATTLGAPLFPHNFVTEASAPYKLMLVIQPRPGVTCTQSTVWTYFDVRLLPKWKLTHYMPTTDLGRFGLELDPVPPELKVVVRLFTVMVAHPVEAFAHGASHYASLVVQRATAMLHQRYDVHHGGRSWRVSFHVEDVGCTTIDRDVSVLEDCAPAVIEQFRAARAHLCVFLKFGRGQSNLQLRAGSEAGNVVLYEAAFDQTLSAGLGGVVVMGQRARLSDELVAAAAVGGPTVRATARAGVVGPRIEIDFALNSAALGGATVALLPALADIILDCRRGLQTLDVWIQGTRTAAEPAGGGLLPLERLRLDAVVAALNRPGLNAQVSTATNAPAGVVSITTCHRDAGEETAFITTQVIRYCAAVHEFSHALGLPDEYADYSTPGPWLAAAPSQPALRNMAAAEGFAAWPRPERERADLMAAGETFHPRYYLTLLEAIRKVTGLGDGLADPGFTVNPAPIVANPANVPLAPEFAPAVQAVAVGEQRIAAGITAVATINLAMSQAAQASGARVLYAKVLDRATLAPVGVVTGPIDRLLLAVGIKDGRHALHVGRFVQPRLVEPIIEVLGHALKAGNRYTVAKRAPTDPPRQPVLLRSSGPFTGHGTFTCASAGIQFYDAPVAGNLMAVAGGLVIPAAQLAPGVTFHAQGTLHNAAMTLTLTATTGQVSAATAQATLDHQVGTPRMEVYSFSVDPNEAVRALSADERRTDGAFVAVADPTSAHMQNVYTRVVVWIPNGYVQRMIFRVKIAHPAPASVAIYKDGSNTAKGSRQTRRIPGNPERWMEYELNPAGGGGGHFGGGAAQSMTLWLEGLHPSGQPKDVLVQLVGTQFAHGAPATIHDTFTATVIQCPSLTVEIPTTPPLTARPATPNNAPPPAQTFSATATAALLGGAAPNAERNFATNPPVVLIQGSASAAQPVKLVARFSPGRAAVRWYSRRAPDDDPGIAQAHPHDDGAPLARLRQQVNGNELTVDLALPTNAAGSFHVEMKAGASTCYVLNAVVAEVTALAGPEVPAVGNLAHEKNQIVGGFVQNALVAHTGPVPFPNPAGVAPAVLKNQACTVLAGRVRVLGGGADGRRGVDRVFVGWIQNKIHSRLEGTYRDGPAAVNRTCTGVFVQNQATGPLTQVGGGADHYFSGALVPQPIQSPLAPLLDTGSAQIGGSGTRLGSSTMDRHNLAIGQDITAVSVDSPGTEFVVNHSTFRDALLVQADYEHTFRAFLCAWTDATRQNLGGAGPGPGDLLYAAVGQVDWGFRARWAVTWPPPLAAMTRLQRNAVVGWQAQATITPDVGRDFNATITVPYARYPARPAEGLVEVRWPTPIRSFAWDARV